MNIKITIDQSAIDKATRQLEEYTENLREKANQICERLATYGAVQASLGFSRAFYTGQSNFDISVEPIDNGYAIIAGGETVLFLEFGAGVSMGYGHPQAGEFGMGPGTYPGKGHWDQPYGWWIPGGEHTYGNPPTMAMYNTSKEIEQEVERVAREVLLS